MTKQNLSGCLSDKQISVLNTRFTELPFEFGCVLDEIFFKLVSAVSNQEFCDHADTPQDTLGEDVFVCINDGNCLFVPKADVIAALETTTQAQYDDTTHTITYIDEDGNPTNIQLNCATAELDDATNEIVYTDEKGNETRISLDQDCLTSPNGLHTICVDDDGCLVVSNLLNATPLDNTTAEGFLGYDANGRIKPMALADTLDIKCVTLCDVGNNNEPYILEVTSNLTQGTKTTATFELDGVTPYTVIEAGAYKPKDYETQKVWIVDGTSATNEAVEQYWEASAIDTGNGGDNAPLSESFTLLDSCGLPLHENAPDATNLITADGAPTTDNTTANLSHQNQVDLFLCIPRGGAVVRLDVVGDVNTEFYSAKCGSKLALEYASPNPVSATAPDYERYFTEGIYQIRYYIDDVSQNGREQLRWSLGGGTFGLIPIENIFSSVPSIENDLVKVCVDTGEITRLDGTPLAVTDKVYYCDPCADFVASDSTADEKEYDLMKVWLTDLTSQTTGAREQFWEASINTPAGGAFDSTEVDLIFSELDGCGLPLHPNAPDAINNIQLAGAESSESSGTNIPNQNQVDFTVFVPKGGAALQFNFIGVANHAGYFSKCGAKLEKVAASTVADQINLGFHGAGFYNFRYYVNDATANGRGTVRWQLGGTGGFSAVPVTNIYEDKQGADACLARVCKETGDITDLEGNEFPAGTEVFLCNPCAE